jgi:hypothetical protein
MSLDTFLSKYISEDNASFGAILVKFNETRAVKAKFAPPALLPSRVHCRYDRAD